MEKDSYEEMESKENPKRTRRDVIYQEFQIKIFDSDDTPFSSDGQSGAIANSVNTKMRIVSIRLLKCQTSGGSSGSHQSKT